MDMSFPVKETIEARKSVRAYLEKPLTSEDREKILCFIKELTEQENPFSVRMRIKLFDVSDEVDLKALGTYGVIKGARTYLAVACQKAQRAPEAVGYCLEGLVLYAQSLGLGTCWLGGTFNKGEFERIVCPGEDEVFPIATPIGYPAPKRHTVDKIMRRAISADKRKGWDRLFFDEDFSRPLTKQAAGEYAFALDMLRLAPSAVNKQPWRVVREKDSFHFYEKKESSSAFDLQRLDVGIALRHFELALREQGITGELCFEEPDIEKPSQTEYLFSFLIK